MIVLDLRILGLVLLDLLKHALNCLQFLLLALSLMDALEELLGLKGVPLHPVQPSHSISTHSLIEMGCLGATELLLRNPWIHMNIRWS